MSATAKGPSLKYLEAPVTRCFECPMMKVNSVFLGGDATWACAATKGSDPNAEPVVLGKGNPLHIDTPNWCPLRQTPILIRWVGDEAGPLLAPKADA